MVKRSAFWRHLEQFPPIMVRLMSRTGRGRGARALTTSEIARTSGLHEDKVGAIAQRTDWQGVDIKDAEAFCRGCNFDPTVARDRRDKCYMYLELCEKKGREPWWYLRNTKEWPNYQKMILKLKSSLSSSTKSPAIEKSSARP